MKKLIFFTVCLLFYLHLIAQKNLCTFNKAYVTIHFGKGDVQDLNSPLPYNYNRVPYSCPQDGNYTYTSSCYNCFGGDWFDLSEDHTPGDAEGNMMLVNASWRTGAFFSTTIPKLKANTIYEFGAWMMNVCRISDKCPYPLLPDITVRLKDTDGKIVLQMSLGELQRRESPQWTQYKAVFTAPAEETPLVLSMINNNPGGCGNDFVLDDITFKECVKIVTVAKKTEIKPLTPAKKETLVTVPDKRVSPAEKPAPKKQSPVTSQKPTVKRAIETPDASTRKSPEPVTSKKLTAFPPPPPVLTVRANPLVKQFEMEAGEIKIDLYDNGQIDGDTVSIYHNNTLLVSRSRLSQDPITFRIRIDEEHPHHELVMVAENLGSIPPNTSVMIVTAGSKKYEVFISSTEQKNARVVFDLK